MYWPHVSEAECCNTEGVSSVLANDSRAAPAAQPSIAFSAQMKDFVRILSPFSGRYQHP